MKLEGLLIIIPKEAETVISVLEAHGHEACLVGGCVRDALMGLEPKDYDICTSALPEEVCGLFEKVLPTGMKHGTVTVMMNNLSLEVTTFRVDADYTDHRRPDEVIFSSSLLEDLKRRDFTINAMAYHPKKGIIDPFGGSLDLQRKIIQTVGDPKKRFDEDALRMLRAARFKARFGFSVNRVTMDAIRDLAGTIRYVSRERILTEMNGILLSSFPEAMRMLFETGLAGHIFPIPVPTMPELKNLGMLPGKLSVRWAALLIESGFHGVEALQLLCESFKMSAALTRNILAICSIFQKPMPQTGYTLRKTLSEVGMDIFTDALVLAEVFGASQKKIERIMGLLKVIITEKHCLRLADMAVNGVVLLDEGFPAGKQLGDLLEALFTCVLQNPTLNQKELLLDMARQMKAR